MSRFKKCATVGCGRTLGNKSKGYRILTQSIGAGRPIKYVVCDICAEYLDSLMGEKYNFKTLDEETEEQIIAYLHGKDWRNKYVKVQ